MNEIRLTLPCPPSVNSCYATNFVTKRRFKTKKYEEWERDAFLALQKQPKKKITGDEWLAVGYYFYFPLYNKNGSKKVKDLENYFKSLSDFLGTQISGFDDHKIKRYLTPEKFDSDRNEVEIVIREIIE